MKFFCNGMELSNATNIVSKAVAANKNIPILEGIRISAQGTKVFLSAFNQELYIEKTISADIYEEGEAIVNGKLFNDCANKLSTVDKVGIEKGIDENITISFNRSTMQLKFFESVGFAELGEYSDENSVTIKERDLKELFERVIFCVSTGNENRMLLKSCTMEVKDGIMESVCLDGFRCAISRKPVIKEQGKVKCVVLGKIINDIIKILSDSDEEVKLINEKKTLIIDLKHTKIRTTLIDCDFFNYNNILGRFNSSDIIVNKEDIEGSLTRASIISRESNNTITLTVGDNRILINSENEKGRVDESVECKFDGEQTRIALNNKYLSDAINRIKEDYLKIEIEESRKPVIVTRVDGDDYRCIILPIRMMS